MSTFGLGHNSGASPSFDAASDLPRDIPRMHFFKCDIDALWDVLVEMPLELGGFYMRAILAMYKHMEGLPADDDIARMRLGGMDVRTYRRLKAALLARPKCLIVKPSGRVSNERFEEEISAYVTAFKNKREAALERESRKRAEQRNDGGANEVPGKVQAKSDGSPAEVGPMSTNKPSNFGGQKVKIVNEINDGGTTSGPEKNHSDTRNTVLRARVIRTRGSEDNGESESLPQTQSPVAPLSETSVSDVGKPRRYSDQFEAFWSGYPDKRNNSKVMAWQAWQRLTPADRVAAIASLPHFARYCQENPEYRAVHVERYLKQRRFESHSGGVANLATSPGATRAWWQNPTTVAGITPERWRKAIAQHANGIWPIDKLGPPPGSPDCVVPADVVTELRLTETYDPAGVRRGYTPGGATT